MVIKVQALNITLLRLACEHRQTLLKLGVSILSMAEPCTLKYTIDKKLNFFLVRFQSQKQV